MREVGFKILILYGRRNWVGVKLVNPSLYESGWMYILTELTQPITWLGNHSSCMPNQKYLAQENIKLSALTRSWFLVGYTKGGVYQSCYKVLDLILKKVFGGWFFVLVCGLGVFVFWEGLIGCLWGCGILGGIWGLWGFVMGL